MYCKTAISSTSQLRKLFKQAGTVNHNEETPSMVQSIQSLRQAKESIHDKYAEESKVSSESGGESVEVADDRMTCKQLFKS